MGSLRIKYQCQHLTCRMAQCYQGELILNEEKFKMFCQNNTEPGCLTSPSSVCKIGHTQTFKIIEAKEIEEPTETIAPNSVTLVTTTTDAATISVPTATAIPVDNRNLEEKINDMGELYNKIVDHCNELTNGMKGRIDQLEARIIKLETAKKGGKVSRRT